MREEILAAIDKIEDEYLIDDKAIHFIEYLDSIREFPSGRDAKGHNACKEYNQ